MLIKQVIEFELMGPGTPGHRRSQEARGSRSNWNVIYYKNVAKKHIVSSVSVSFSTFRVQRLLLAFVNNTRGPGSPSIQFLPTNLNV